MEAYQEQLWVQQSRLGDKKAYEQLVCRHYRHILGMCLGILTNSSDAQDICQDTFLRGFEKIIELKDDAQFAGWIAAIARRLCLDYLRKCKMDKQARKCLSIEQVQNRSDFSDLAAAIEKLPAEYRIPLLMYYFDGRDESAIAGHLVTSQSTVSRRIQAAKQLLYDFLSEK